MSANLPHRPLIALTMLAVLGLSLTPCGAAPPEQDRGGAGSAPAVSSHDFGSAPERPQEPVRTSASAPAVHRDPAEQTRSVDGRATLPVQTQKRGFPLQPSPEQEAFAYAWAAGQPCFSTAQCFQQAFDDRYGPLRPIICEYPRYSGRYIFLVDRFTCP